MSRTFFLHGGVKLIRRGETEAGAAREQRPPGITPWAHRGDAIRSIGPAAGDGIGPPAPLTPAQTLSNDRPPRLENSRGAPAEFSSVPKTATLHFTLNRDSRTALGGCPVFADLSPADHARLLAGTRVDHFSRAEVLFLEGQPVEEVSLLLSGMVKLTKLGASGKVAILGLAVPGDVLGAANLISAGAHTATAEPVHPCRALVWRASTFKRLVESRPAVLASIVRDQAERVQELEERFHDMATEMVGARVARQLARLHEKMVGDGSDPVKIHLSHEELAQMTGTNLCTIGRLLSEWEATGAVRSRRRAVTVFNVELLRDMYDQP